MSEYGYDRRGGREQHRRGGGRDEHEDDLDDRGRNTLQRFDSIQDPGKRYLLRECIGSGVCGDVYEAIDQQAGTVSAIGLYNCQFHDTFSSTRVVFLQETRESP